MRRLDDASFFRVKPIHRTLIPRESRWQKLRRGLKRKVTLLVVPHSTHRPWQAHLSVSFLLFCLALWSGLTLWAGFFAGRNLDYWITKADNQVLRMKMSYFEGEFDRSREVLSQAEKTDRQLRALLAMNSRRAIVESEGMGGPDPRSPADFGRALGRASEEPSQPEFRRVSREIEQESKRRLASFQEIAWYVASQRTLYRATPSIWPAPGRITSTFGYRISPFNGEPGGEFHPGVDIANAPETPILASADGVVRFAGWQSGYGRAVLLDHGFGYSTLYGHTSRLAVKLRQSVRRGQVIAYMGTTGRSTGEHLHYEVWRDGKPVNPMKFLKDRPADPKGILLSANEDD